MQTEYIYPTLGDRTSPKEWAEIGRPDLLVKAAERVEQLKALPIRAGFDPATDARLRDLFRVYLPRQW